MPGSDLRRRSRNGPIRPANCRALVGSRPDSIGPAQTLRNAWRLPSSPGVAQSRIAQSSVRLFSTGVPVSATRAADGTVRRARAVAERAFLTCCASSATTSPHGTAASAPGVAPDGAVGGEDEAGVGGGVGGREVVERALAAVEAAYGDAGGEAPDLGLPVAEEGGRADHQGRPGTGGGAVEVEGDQGDRLAQPHVVGQAGTEPEGGDALEPGEALALVVAEHGREPGRGRQRRCGRGVEELLADLQQAGADDDLGGCVVDLDDAGQRGGHGLRRLHGADQAVARLAGDRTGRRPSSHRAAGASATRPGPGRPSRPR